METVKRVDSPKNPEVKALVRLRERRVREREGRFLVEGAREVARALAAGVPLERFYTCSALLTEAARGVLEGAPEVEMTGLSSAAFERVSYRENPDGLLATAFSRPLSLSALVLPADALVLVVDGLEKPGNLGALLRTADGADVSAVFATGAGTDLTNPNVIRSSMGSVFARPVMHVPAAELLEWLQGEGFRLVAATPHTKTLYWDVSYRGRVAILLGAEDRGLSEVWLGAAGVRVAIPMGGLADSLNVATAGALLLYEALRQRREPFTPRQGTDPGGAPE